MSWCAGRFLIKSLNTRLPPPPPEHSHRPPSCNWGDLDPSRNPTPIARPKSQPLACRLRAIRATLVGYLRVYSFQSINSIRRKAVVRYTLKADIGRTVIDVFAGTSR